MSVHIPVNYGEAAFIMSGANGTQPFVCTLGVDLGHYAGSESVAADNLFGWWAINLNGRMHESMALERVLIAVGQPDGTAPTVSSSLPAANGTRDSANVPINCAVIINKTTGLPGRKGRGRMFLPGMLSEGEAGLSGELNGTTRTWFNGTFSDMYTALNEGTEEMSPIPPVLLHSDPDVEPTALLAFTCASVVGTMRKRIR